MSRIVTAAIPVHGHTGPLLAITADLVIRGHEVVFLGGSRFAGRAEAVGARFVALPAESDFDDRDLAAAFPGREQQAPGRDRLVYDVKHVFTDPVPGQYRALRALLADFPADAVIADLAFTGAAALALALPRGRRPEVISIGTSAPTLPSVDTAPFGLALPPLAGEAGRARNRVLNAEAEQAVAPLRDYLADTLAGLGLTLPEGSHRAVVPGLADHYLLLTVPGLEYPRSDAPANFRCVGALPEVDAKVDGLPHWWGELTRGRPVVVVTQGTVANRDLTELVAPTVRALADRDLLVVAATARPDGPRVLTDLLGELPANTRAAGYLPFDLLLPHADLLVTNGGYGGVHSALRHGVPLVVAGATEDKPEVAARVQWSGAGVDLRTGRPEPAAVAEAVTRVLHGAGYRERATALRSELAGHRPLDAIAGLVAGLG